MPKEKTGPIISSDHGPYARPTESSTLTPLEASANSASEVTHMPSGHFNAQGLDGINADLFGIGAITHENLFFEDLAPASSAGPANISNLPQINRELIDTLLKTNLPKEINISVKNGDLSAAEKNIIINYINTLVSNKDSINIITLFIRLIDQQLFEFTISLWEKEILRESISTATKEIQASILALILEKSSFKFICIYLKTIPTSVLNQLKTGNFNLFFKERDPSDDSYKIIINIANNPSQENIAISLLSKYRKIITARPKISALYLIYLWDKDILAIISRLVSFKKTELTQLVFDFFLLVLNINRQISLSFITNFPGFKSHILSLNHTQKINLLTTIIYKGNDPVFFALYETLEFKNVIENLSLDQIINFLKMTCSTNRKIIDVFYYTLKLPEKLQRANHIPFICDVLKSLLDRKDNKILNHFIITFSELIKNWVIPQKHKPSTELIDILKQLAQLLDGGGITTPMLSVLNNFLVSIEIPNPQAYINTYKASIRPQEAPLVSPQATYNSPH